MRPHGIRSGWRTATRGRLVLEDGAVFPGISFGVEEGAAGETVFTTGMVGYPEALTDPSYRGQILTFTYPSIGNYGVPAWSEPHANPSRSDGVGEPIPRPRESERIQAAGLICSTYSEEFSHHTAEMSLGSWLMEQRIPALTGVDTRALTRRIRIHGALLGRIEIDGRPVPRVSDPNRRNLVAEVSTRQVLRFGRRGLPLTMIDCGRKNNQVRMLVERGAQVTVIPWDSDVRRVPRDCAGVIVSNGPGDPRMVASTVETVRALMRRRVPILGICLGHQILALAAGASTYKMKFGHRSHNQPCVETGTARCYQTSQNHGFSVDGRSLPRGWTEWFVNANDGSNEGIRHRSGLWRSVQFHPEAAPGPGGTTWILDQFLEAIR
ncbi:MAG: glutamine-hydrolyzing carbamoyl-phosphate synthase small subunit [Acidobacteria bacterium]|nr:glutamine-hydrolyzing carbamoyl-phosphate synthase small subunit [Acidobacteriota bacterium]